MVEQKLSNEKFVSRAPEAVVNAEKEKAAKYKELIASWRDRHERCRDKRDTKRRAVKFSRPAAEFRQKEDSGHGIITVRRLA